MSGKKAFEVQIAALDALREAPEGERVAALRKALGQRNNFLVAKAADLVREFTYEDLIPDLLKAFDRFFENPEKNDPQCWAKNAIGRTLAALELQDAEAFLRGMRYIQLEPTWGGKSDSAATLRSTCALALVQCRELREPELLKHLVDMLGDKDKSVRTEVMRAIEQVNSTSAALLLRERAVLGNDEPEVLGACYSGILRVEGVGAIPWVSRFLESGDDAAAEAALAIAGMHSPEAFEALKKCLEDPFDRLVSEQKLRHSDLTSAVLHSDDLHSADPWFRSVLLSAIALTRQDAALDFLLDLVRRESRDAEQAVEAILRSGASKEVVQKLEKLAAANPRLARAFSAQRGSS